MLQIRAQETEAIIIRETDGRMKRIVMKEQKECIHMFFVEEEKSWPIAQFASAIFYLGTKNHLLESVHSN
jgi:hypothetical protein